MELASDRKRRSVLRMELEWAKRGCRARSTKQRARLERLEALKNGKAPVQETDVQMDSVETRMGKKTVELHHISKSYGDKVILDDFDYIVLRNQRLGIIGPNGCGKTTIMKMLVGLLHADSGEFRIFEKKPDEEIDVMSQVGCMIENPVFYPYLTAYENLKILLRFYPELSQKRIDEVLEELELTKYKDEPVEKFSMGMKQRLGFGAAILHKPKLLILDEPTNGLDIKGTAKIRHILKAYTQSGGTILISSHIAVSYTHLTLPTT